jgi:hypothetical protein
LQRRCSQRLKRVLKKHVQVTWPLDYAKVFPTIRKALKKNSWGICLHEDILRPRRSITAVTTLR